MSVERIFSKLEAVELSQEVVEALDYLSKRPQQLNSFGPHALIYAAFSAVSVSNVRADVLNKALAEIGRRNLMDFSPKLLTLLCWILASVERRDEALLAPVGWQLAERCCDFATEDVIKCMYAYSELKVLHEAMMEALTLEVMWRIDQLSARSLARVAVACARLQYCKQPLFDWLATRLCQKHDRTLDDVSSTVWAFAKASVQHARLCQVAAEDASRADACTFTEEQHARLMWAFGAPHLETPAIGLPRPLFHAGLTEAWEEVLKEKRQDELSKC